LNLIKDSFQEESVSRSIVLRPNCVDEEVDGLVTPVPAANSQLNNKKKKIKLHKQVLSMSSFKALNEQVI